MSQKLENNSDNNNITNKNEGNKSSTEPKKTINIENLDLSKINNLKRKESFEEEEIVPLI
jgi:hypothetical protein